MEYVTQIEAHIADLWQAGGQGPFTATVSPDVGRAITRAFNRVRQTEDAPDVEFATISLFETPHGQVILYVNGYLDGDRMYVKSAGANPNIN